MSDFVLYGVGPVIVALGMLVVAVVAAGMVLLALNALWLIVAWTVDWLVTRADRLVAWARYEIAWPQVHRGGRR